MELDAKLRKEFSEEVRNGVRELIDLNEIDDLEDFDAGLYISNVFERVLKEQPETRNLRTFLWSSVYNDLEIEKYENYIKESL